MLFEETRPQVRRPLAQVQDLVVIRALPTYPAGLTTSISAKRAQLALDPFLPLQAVYILMEGHASKQNQVAVLAQKAL